jgi:hypothetical protein
VPVPNNATSGNVVVTVGGVPSNGFNFVVVPVTTTLTLVQHASKDAGTTTSSTLAFSSNNAAGNWIGVVIRASTSGQLFTVTDTRTNTYRKAVQLNETVDGTTLAIYYAENIAAGANTISVSDTASGTLRFAIFEYSGIMTANSLDASAVAQGTSASPSSGTMTTTANGDLLLGAMSTANPQTFTAGTGYTARERVPATGTKLMVEDGNQAAAGATSANAALSATDNWGAVLASFKTGSGNAPPPISVSVLPTAASTPAGSGTQNFTATVQNDSLNQGVTWSLSGTGCVGSFCGTLINVAALSVTYNAPVNVPNPATVTLTATSKAANTKSASATITVTPNGTAPGVGISPKRGGLVTSQTMALSASVLNDVGNAGVSWVATGGTLAGQTTSSATFSSATAGSFTITATSVADSSKSASATIGVTNLASVSTYHNNLSRDGTNTREFALTTSSVTPTTFGKLFSCPVDGAVYAQPLWVPNVTIGGGTHNVIFVATEHDSVYAFDADGAATCTQYWQASLLDAAHGAGTGAAPVNPGDTSELGDISGEIGITGTPVIDTISKALYVVSKTKESSVYHQRLHALNLSDGSEKVSPPMDITSTITVPGSGDTGDSSVGCTATSGRVPFCPLRENQRPGLVLNNGIVYVTWASHGDIQPYHGWIMGFNAATLARVFTFNDSPDGRGGGIWMAGAAPAVDSSNNLYILTGNGDFNADALTPPNTDYGDSLLKLNSSLVVTDSFTPKDEGNLDAADLDLGSGGAAIVVDLPLTSPVQHLLVGGGKGTGFDGELYVVNRDNLGKWDPATDHVVQEFPLGSGIFATAAFWQNTLYIAAAGKPLRAFTLDPTTSTFNTLTVPQSSNTFGFPGVSPSVSSSGTSNGIVWAIDSSQNGMSDTNPARIAGPAVLHAYDATNLATELWNSSLGTGNTAGNAVKFTVPTVANGRVYIGTRGNDSTQGSGTIKGQLDVYGLLPN